ncbi:nuclear RNA export factor 1-like [Xenia sp. Carnegie-2017]|uniref:nuclear RNA export factor 1-like n=1 Tax=Xenia sp. Carnegie-2017 TaxID=2897299 RepID=UPI001F0448B6|nr:nuclear RNA export factor 1-like [Xenia sp. Carnegie-2017]
MSSGLFNKALKGFGLSITTSRNGGRSFRDEHDDRMSDPYSPSPSEGKQTRGSLRRGRDHWRGSRRGRYTGRNRGRSRGHVRGRGRGNNQYSSSESPSEDNSFDGDGDVDMESGGGMTQSRYTPYSRPVRQHSGGKFYNARFSGNQCDQTWNRVMIPYGRNHNKEWLLNKLQKSCDVTIQPIKFHYYDDNAIFFVNDQRSATALRSISGTIMVRDGSKLLLHVRPCKPPNITGLDEPDGEESIDPEVLKRSLDTRYDSSTDTLDLSNFYNDRVLKENDMQGILNKFGLLGTIVTLIKEHCQQLKKINLRGNRLFSLDSLKDLHEAAPGIVTLDLGENNIRHLNELRKLKSLKELKSLVLNGNPLCDGYARSQARYISDVTSIFPKLTMLDECELPPRIGFDVPSASNLPEIKGSFVRDENVKKLVLPFIKQYFAIYDSEDRKNLLNVYDNEAVFSMCVVDFSKDRGSSFNSLSVYRKYSRNMKYLYDIDRRCDLIKSSQLAVVAFLNELPSTKHHVESFIVDVSLLKETCIGFTICGLFKEGKSEDLRAFTRAMIAVPAPNNSILIINDQLTLKSPTQEQRKNANNSPGFGVVAAPINLFPVSATPVSSPNPLASLGPQTITSSQVGTNSQLAVSALNMASSISGLSSQQQEMLKQFSSQSNMNLQWSYKALSDNGWDFNKTAEVFTKLHSQAKIPKEAFTKLEADS